MGEGFLADRFGLQAALRSDSAQGPAALVEGEGSKARVREIDEEARAEGVEGPAPPPLEPVAPPFLPVGPACGQIGEVADGFVDDRAVPDPGAGHRKAAGAQRLEKRLESFPIDDRLLRG